ncbi:hypothetical protein M432DRAFT_653528 [Thermoascus aurantiacus ATCC 26904]
MLAVGNHGQPPFSHPGSKQPAIKKAERGDLLTVRELARIQGFSDDFIFLGPIERQYEQILEAIPPSIAKAIVETILATIDEFRMPPPPPPLPPFPPPRPHATAPAPAAAVTTTTTTTTTTTASDEAGRNSRARKRYRAYVESDVENGDHQGLDWIQLERMVSTLSYSFSALWSSPQI